MVVYVDSSTSIVDSDTSNMVERFSVEPRGHNLKLHEQNYDGFEFSPESFFPENHFNQLDYGNNSVVKHEPSENLWIADDVSLFGPFELDSYYNYSDPMEAAFFKELVERFFKLEKKSKGASKKLKYSTKKTRQLKAPVLAKPTTPRKKAKRTNSAATSTATPKQAKVNQKKPKKAPTRKLQLEDKSKISKSVIPAVKEKTKKRQRRCNEWTPEDIALLLNCTKILINHELKTISQALFHCIKRNPGKCQGRAAEKKLKRLGIFESWTSSDKELVRSRIDKKLAELGDAGKYLPPELISITNKIIKDDKRVYGSSLVHPNPLAQQTTKQTKKTTEKVKASSGTFDCKKKKSS